MIAQFRTLQKVKRLREDRALRALQAARRDVRTAAERVETARAAVAKSERTLPEREVAIYAKIMDQVVRTAEIDLAKERVQQLMAGHQKLIDKVSRARDHLKRCEDAAEKARAAHAARRAEVEKIDTMAKDMALAAANEALAAEEAEIEELFSVPRARPGEAA